MQAIDTNVLVYAQVRGSAHHEKALGLLTGLCEGAVPWAIPWPCVYEFLRVVTHPRVYTPPVPLSVAVEDLERILASPTLLLLHETSRHQKLMQQVLKQSGVTGNLIHDAHIAALCMEHGVSEILTGDGDFARFQGLRMKNPFLG